MTISHHYVTNESSMPDVIRSAELARENSGLEQWIHHHPHGVLCDHRCGPLHSQPQQERT